MLQLRYLHLAAAANVGPVAIHEGVAVPRDRLVIVEEVWVGPVTPDSATTTSSSLPKHP